MADIVERIIFDDTAAIKSLNNMNDLLEEVADSYQDLKDTVDKTNKDMSKQVEDGSKKQAEATKKVAEEHRKAKNSFLDYVKSITVGGVSINTLIGQLSQWKERQAGLNDILKNGAKLSQTQVEGVDRLSKVFGGGRTAITAFAKGFNILKVAIAATGIGALILALAGLIAFLTRTQRGIDLVGQAFAYIGTAVGVFVDKLSAIGERIYNLFSEEGLLGAIKRFGQTLLDAFLHPIDTIRNFGKAVADTAKDMNEAGMAAASLKKERQDLDRQAIQLIKREAEMRAEINKNKKLAEDTTKSYGTRYTAAKRAFELENSLLQAKIKIQEGITENIRKEIALTNSLDADTKRLIESEAALANMKAESYEKQTELQNKINGLLKEAKDSLTQVTGQVIEMAKAFRLISDEEAFEFAKVEQIKALEQMKTQLQSIATIINDPSIPRQIELIDMAIKGLSERAYLPPAPEALAPKIQENLQLAYDIAIPKINPKPVELPGPEFDFEKFISEIDNFQELWEGTLEELFGPLTGEKIAEFTNSAANLISEFGAIANEATDIQLQQIDKQLERLSKRREELQSGLEEELALQEQGLANNVGNKQKEVDGLIAEEERLQKERERLQAQAQRRQLIADTIAQAQSLVTSSINIIKGFSNIPVVGLPLGIAAVGALLAFFAKTKIDAFRATRLHTGADSIKDFFGFGDRYGESDLPHSTGSGYRLVNEKTGRRTNVIISGKEMLLPESVSLPNSQFFDKLKLGHYQGIDLVSALDYAIRYQDAPELQKVVYSSANNVKVESSRPAKQYVPFVTKDGRSGAYLVTIDPNKTKDTIWFDL